MGLFGFGKSSAETKRLQAIEREAFEEERKKQNAIKEKAKLEADRKKELKKIQDFDKATEKARAKGISKAKWVAGVKKPKVKLKDIEKGLKSADKKIKSADKKVAKALTKGLDFILGEKKKPRKPRKKATVKKKPVTKKKPTKKKTPAKRKKK